MVPLVILLLVVVLLVFPIWAFIKIHTLSDDRDSFQHQLRDLESQVRQLRREAAEAATKTAPTKAPPVAVSPPAPAMPSVAAPPVTIAPPPPVVLDPEITAPPFALPVAPPPPAPPPPVIAPEPPRAEPPLPPLVSAPTPWRQPEEPVPEPAPSFVSKINWEQFMGAKFFAWAGGFTAFLAAVFFVKYSFDRGWIPPEVRVALGFLFAISLVVGGLKFDRARYATTSDTLVAAGIVSLYAVSFACRSIYHFAVFEQQPLLLFLLMALITTAAFLLAVRLEARVVAILGILGGFLTPWLLSTGQDNPAGLFGYLALLDIGLVAVALHRRWNFLVPLGAAGTVIMQIGWAAKFFAAEKAAIAMVVCLGFSALFVGTCFVARRRGQGADELTAAAVALPCVCFGFAFYFLGFPEVAGRVGVLFAFLLAASLGLFALAWREEKPALVILAAAGTILLEFAWGARVLTADRAPAAMAASLAFSGVFLGAYLLARRLGRATPEVLWPAVALPFAAFALAFALVGQAEIAARPGLLFTFALTADAMLLAIAWLDDRVPKLHLIAGLVVFLLLAAWTNLRLSSDLLPWALAFYLLHAILHTAFPLVLERRRPAASPAWWSQLFPPLALLLMLGPLFRLEAVSLLFWPCVLLVDLLAIALALFSASLIAVAVVLVLTLAATGLWIFRVPATLAMEFPLLVVLGGFAVLFFAAGTFLARKLGDRLGPGEQGVNRVFGDARSQIPAFSALLPFLLLIMMTQRLPLANPSPVFGLALLLTVLTLGLSCILALEWLPACALAGVAALEYAWHARHFAAAQPALPLTWYLLFQAVFALYPFVFRARFAAMTGPWAVAALGGVLSFPLVYRLVQTAWPNDFLGVVPALFSVPPLLSLIAVLRAPPTDERVRLNLLAWFGGVALLFITLIFPIQFDRQWLTLGWALEGAALVWLFHRVPHAGLRATGAVLLVAAFARLALNPAVLEYHARSDTALFNWYLYSYGVVTACLFGGARLLAPPRERVFGCNTPPLLNTLGTILSFLLLNIEIADFFSVPGAKVLTFQFSGHFGRDMTYTIAWALFALGLLLVSIWKQIRAGRYAALALLGVALLKLFFHDLARLEALYRIGALLGVALIATVASIAYQRFLPGNEKNATPPHP